MEWESMRTTLFVELFREPKKEKKHGRRWKQLGKFLLSTKTTALVDGGNNRKIHLEECKIISQD